MKSFSILVDQSCLHGLEKLVGFFHIYPIISTVNICVEFIFSLFAWYVDSCV